MRQSGTVDGDLEVFSSAEVMPTEAYERSRSLFLLMGRQQKENRRIRLNKCLSLLFENRFTIWLQMQEEARWHETLTQRHLVSILKEKNPLVAPRNELRACLFIDDKSTAISEITNSDCSIAQLSLELTLAGKRFRALPLPFESGDFEAVNYLRFTYVGPTKDTDNFISWHCGGPKTKSLPRATVAKLLDDLRS